VSPTTASQQKMEPFKSIEEDEVLKPKRIRFVVSGANQVRQLSQGQKEEVR